MPHPIKIVEEGFRLRRAAKKRLPLGEYTEQMLRSVGVTEDRYKAAKLALGAAPTCWCAERREWLNRAGAWLSGDVAEE